MYLCATVTFNINGSQQENTHKKSKKIHLLTFAYQVLSLMTTAQHAWVCAQGPVFPMFAVPLPHAAQRESNTQEREWTFWTFWRTGSSNGTCCTHMILRMWVLACYKTKNNMHARAVLVLWSSDWLRPMSEYCRAQSSAGNAHLCYHKLSSE